MTLQVAAMVLKPHHPASCSRSLENRHVMGRLDRLVRLLQEDLAGCAQAEKALDRKDQTRDNEPRKGTGFIYSEPVAGEASRGRVGHAETRRRTGTSAPVVGRRQRGT